jgi:flagellar basal body P-ring protein FlgI
MYSLLQKLAALALGLAVAAGALAGTAATQRVKDLAVVEGVRTNQLSRLCVVNGA